MYSLHTDFSNVLIYVHANHKHYTYFRGYGLFIGLEVVKDKASKEPDGETCVNIVSG